MPASPQSSGTAGSIVLVEEYGALAVAIGSALKKFAPGFSTRAVHSLDAAETALSERKPDLLVVDFDPPQAGALEFFMRLRSIAPSCRVLVIAAAPLSEVATAATPGAFRFVEKPFDLASLGAGVEAALAGGTRRSGTMRDFSLRDIIPLQCLAGHTGVLKVDAGEGRSGEVHFNVGQITHAETTDVDGADALRDMLAWYSPRFKQPKRKPRAARTIEGDWAAVLADALASAAAAPSATADPDEHAPERIGGGKKIVVIDDTEMLLLFVEDSLAAADPTLEIVTASTGAEGIDRVVAMKPDLVLLDYSLPDFNGDEVCRRLLDDARTATIPIIMMSGHVPEMAASALRCENVVATIAKPFLSEALVAMVGKALADPAQFAVRPLTPAAPPPPRTLPPPTNPAEPPKAVKSETPASGQSTSTASVVGNAELVGAPGKIAAPPPPAAPQPSIVSSPAPPAPHLPTVPMTPVAAPVAAPTPASAAPKVALAEAPAPPLPATTAPAQPAVQRTATVAAVPKRAPVTPAPAPQPAARPAIAAAAPARLAAATTNAVVVSITVEVLAVQFSPTLQMAAIRARPASRTISLHVEAGALPGMALPEAGFELGPVHLDARGQIATIRLLPTAQQISPVEPRNAFPVGGVSVLPWNGGKAVELTPAAAAPMTMQLSAPFELVGVELSPTFGVGSLVLKARGGEIRVSFERGAHHSGATFKTAQVLLNRSAHIAEILLDAVA